MKAVWLWSLVGVFGFGCGAGDGRSIVGSRHVAASSGAPDISRVTDLGDLASLPAKGNLSTSESDGEFVIGELILIEGDDFGKLPTIAIGGRPAKSIARTAAGGIVTRIPIEVPAGELSVEVSHPDGRGIKKISVKRLVAAATGNEVQVAVANGDGKLLEASALPVANVEDLCFGHDGQALYLAVPKEKALRAVSVAARGGPVVTGSFRMGAGQFVELACRADVPVLAAVHRRKIFVYDTGVPTAISEAAVVKLADDAVAAALSPDGESIAVLTRESNSLLLVSIATATVVATLRVFENETAPLLRDLVYSPAGDELWLMSGNSVKSEASGTRPTQLHRVAVHGISLSRIGSATIGSATHPITLSVSQREAVMAAAAIRSTAQKATLLLSTQEETSSTLLKTGLDGKAVPLIEGPYALSESVVSHDQAWAYATSWSESGSRIHSLPLANGTASELVFESTGSAAHSAIPLSIAP